MMKEKSASDVFTEIFQNDSWKGRSKSGPGSTLAVTAPLRSALPSTFNALGVQTLIDAPCGTAEWITTVTGNLRWYIGCDIVEEAVWSAAHQNRRDNHFFTVADITSAILPTADAIFCRDCLVHFPLDLAITAIERFKESGSKYLFTTNFPSVEINMESRLGSWRTLNMRKAPFNWPEPLMSIPDRLSIPNDRYADKSIGIWELSSLP